jgi:uncharacterized protein (DUF1330 family)
MPAYAVAHMRQVTMGPPIVEYLERIDATLAPFGGRFIVHGGETEVLEGSWPGFVIVIEFADTGRARAWYRSGSTWASRLWAPTRAGARRKAPAPSTCRSPSAGSRSIPVTSCTQTTMGSSCFPGPSRPEAIAPIHTEKP